MSKSFVLKIENRASEKEFFVTLQVREDNAMNSTEAMGRLPPCLELFITQKRWSF